MHRSRKAEFSKENHRFKSCTLRINLIKIKMKNNDFKKNVYLGLWFQRTSLHLKEFYYFLNNQKIIDGLDKEKCDYLRNNLEIESLNLKKEDGVSLLLVKSKEVEFSMTEDGVILINSTFKSIKENANLLKDFYIDKLSPAIAYVFSRGAPLPKDLSNITEIYPLYFLDLKIEDKDVEECFNLMINPNYLIENNGEVEIYSGDEMVIINILDNKELEVKKTAKEFICNLIVFREFEKQLSSYLNVHRRIWEDLEEIRNNKNMRTSKFSEIRNKIHNHQRTLAFVKARLLQMEDILLSREFSLNNVDREILKKTEMLNRFKILSSEQHYILNLWDMTSNYANETLDLLDSLIAEGTEKEIKILQTISVIGVVVAFFAMGIPWPWHENWNQMNYVSFSVFGIIIVFIILFQFFLKIISHKKVKINDK